MAKDTKGGSDSYSNSNVPPGASKTYLQLPDGSKKYINRFILLLSLIFVGIAGIILVELLRLSEDKKHVLLETERLAQDKKEVSLSLGEFWDHQLTLNTRQIFKAFKNWYVDSKDSKDDKDAWLKVISKGIDNVPGSMPQKCPDGFCEMARSLGYLSNNDRPSLKEIELLRVGLVTMLNTMEHIAAAHEYGAADKQIIEAFFKGSIVYYYGYLEDFAEVFRAAEPGQWDVLIKKYHEWGGPVKKKETKNK